MTLAEFYASRRAVPDVRAALLPLGYDYGDEWAVPGYVVADDCGILGPGPDGSYTTWWCSEVMTGTLNECVIALYNGLKGEGLI